MPYARTQTTKSKTGRLHHSALVILQKGLTMNNRPELTPTTPRLFNRSDWLLIVLPSVLYLYINFHNRNSLEAFSSPLGICTGLTIVMLISLFLRQGWSYHQSIPNIPSVRLLKPQWSWNRLFREKKLFTSTEFLLISAVVAGIFIADKITTGTYNSSIIINFILCLAMLLELLRRQYWKNA